MDTKYVARQAQKANLDFNKQDNCFTAMANPRNLRKSQTPRLETRLHGAYYRSVIVGFIPSGSVLLST
jgi:hypothetical protein